MFYLGRILLLALGFGCFYKILAVSPPIVLIWIAMTITGVFIEEYHGNKSRLHVSIRKIISSIRNNKIFFITYMIISRFFLIIFFFVLNILLVYLNYSFVNDYIIPLLDKSYLSMLISSILALDFIFFTWEWLGMGILKCDSGPSGGGPSNGGNNPNPGNPTPGSSGPNNAVVLDNPDRSRKEVLEEKDYTAYGEYMEYTYRTSYILKHAEWGTPDSIAEYYHSLTKSNSSSRSNSPNRPYSLDRPASRTRPFSPRTYSPDRTITSRPNNTLQNSITQTNNTPQTSSILGMTSFMQSINSTFKPWLLELKVRESDILEINSGKHGTKGRYIEGSYHDKDIHCWYVNDRKELVKPSRPVPKEIWDIMDNLYVKSAGHYFLWKDRKKMFDKALFYKLHDRFLPIGLTTPPLPVVLTTKT